MKGLLLIAVTFLSAHCLFAQSDPARPVFSEYAMDGKKIESDKLVGKVVVINLWFVNCPNCIDEIKSLNTMVDDYQGNKEVVFVAFAASKKSDVAKFLLKNPFKYQVVPDAMKVILSKFGTPDKNGEIIVPFPMHFVLDRTGRIVLKEQGIKGVDKVKSELKRQFAAKVAALI